MSAIVEKVEMDHPSETLLNAWSAQTAGCSTVLANAARIARVSYQEADPDKKLMWDTGSSVTGPLVYLYAKWVIDRAKAEGISDLWFLARDASFPLLAARAILEMEPVSGLNVRYIYGSRVTYAPLDIERLGEREWNQLATHAKFKYANIQDIQHALCCEEDVFQRHLPRLGFNSADWSRVLEEDESQKIRAFALDDKAFNDDIVRSIANFKAMTLEYFKSEGFSADRGVALVDTGWTGRSHYPLYRFLKNQGCENIQLFYLGLTSKEPLVPLDDIRTFLFDNARGTGPKKNKIFYPRPVESLLLSNHGRTRSFLVNRRKKTIEPVLDPIENTEFIEKYYDIYKSGISAFMDAVRKSGAGTCDAEDMPDIAEAIISRFWRDPTKEEVRVWSQLTWEWDPLGTIKYPLARSYQLRDLWIAFQQGRTPDCHGQFWRAGAEKLTPSVTLKAIRGAGELRRFCGRCARAIGAVREKREGS